MNDTSAPKPRVYVLGTPGRLQVGDAVFVTPPATGHYAFSQRTCKIPAGLRVRAAGRTLTFGAAMRRGVAVENVIEGRPFYARVLPEDAEAGLAELDARIADAQKALAALQADRQGYLIANIVRGERIGQKHATAPSPPRELVATVTLRDPNPEEKVSP